MTDSTALVEEELNKTKLRNAPMTGNISTFTAATRTVSWEELAEAERAQLREFGQRLAARLTQSKRDERRAEVKAAFMEGFDAARKGTSAQAWEDSGVRFQMDYLEPKVVHD